MRTTLTALSFAAAIGVICCQSAGAVPIGGATAMQDAATAAAPVQKAQYTERRTRHGTVKCYRELVFGRYVCHRYHTW